MKKGRSAPHPHGSLAYSARSEFTKTSRIINIFSILLENVIFKSGAIKKKKKIAAELKKKSHLGHRYDIFRGGLRAAAPLTPDLNAIPENAGRGSPWQQQEA